MIRIVFQIIFLTLTGCSSMGSLCRLPVEASLPADARFVTRVREFVGLETEGECEDQFLFLPMAERQYLSSAAIYCEKKNLNQPFQVIGFVPDFFPSDFEAVTTGPMRRIRFEGCAETVGAGGTRRALIRVALVSWYENDEWFFRWFVAEAPVGPPVGTCDLTESCKAAWFPNASASVPGETKLTLTVPVFRKLTSVTGQTLPTLLD